MSVNIRGFRFPVLLDSPERSDDAEKCQLQEIEGQNLMALPLKKRWEGSGLTGYLVREPFSKKEVLTEAKAFPIFFKALGRCVSNSP
jgi:hypothetical protein